MRVHLGCFLLFPAVIMFRQSLYTLKYERLEVFRYNTSYIGFVKTHNFKYNRTTAVTNMTIHIKRSWERKLKVEIQAYRFASNEYRLFPLRFGLDFCSCAESNDFGLHRFFECGNLTGCPIKAGWYRICNFSPDGKRFPPLIPMGSYMIDLVFYLDSVEISYLQGYGTVKYPEV